MVKNNDSEFPKVTKDASSPNTVLITSVGVTLIAIAFHFIQGEESLFLTVIPKECLVYPPSSDCVILGLPWILGAMTIVMAVNVVLTITEKPTKETQENIEKQSDRRHEIVKEMVDELEDREDLTDGEIHGIRFNMIFERVRDLLAIPNFDRDLMNNGVYWTFALYKKELEIAINKTRKGDDILYASGKKLGGLLGDAYRVCDKASEANAALVGEERADFWRLVKDGRRLYFTLGLRTVKKACLMLLKARNALIWVVIQTLGTTVTAMVDASAWHYRVMVLESMFEGRDAFWKAAKAMFLIGVLRKFLELMTNMMRIRGACRVACEVQVLLFDALIKMDLTWWSIQAMENSQRGWDEEVGIYTVINASWRTEEFLEIPQDIVEALASALSHAVIITRTSSKALWLQLGVNVGLALVQWILRFAFKRLEAMAKRGLVAPSEDDYTFYYALSPEYISTFQSYVRGEKEVNSFKSYVQHEIQEDKREALVECLQDPITKSLSMGGEVAQMSLASDLVSAGRLGVAQANGVMSASEKISSDMQGLWRMASKAIEKAHPLAQAYDLCVLPKSIDPDVGLRPVGRCKGHIQFENVSFAYPRREVDVLKGVSFEVLPGESLGMTGTAGCGKSTAMRLLERFYDVSGGRILLDGRDIREYNPRWLRSQIATVAQEPMLLPGLSIRENITFGCSYEPTLLQIHDACKAANIYDSLMNKDKFPSGLRTEMGAVQNVSGGEKQRIAIARAIMADPPVLLLDEATSALDEENQSKVQEALNKLMKGRTTMVIAHRLSTIKDSSKIVAFKAGKVVECGSHDELVNQEDSVYGALWKRQCSHPELIDDVEDSDLEEEEEELDTPFPQVQRRASFLVACGNNPPPSVATRLEALEQRINRLANNDATHCIAKEAKKVLDHMKYEASIIRSEKENTQHSHDSRAMVLTATGVNRWKAHTEKGRRGSTGSTDPKLKTIAKKILFLNRHAKIKQQLSGMDESKTRNSLLMDDESARWMMDHMEDESARSHFY